MNAPQEAAPATAIAVVFPGQGAQRFGMARDFVEAFSVSRETFEEASDALSFSMADLCFERNERLNLTPYTQPALLTAELAMYRALVKEGGLQAACFGGHSLGEFTALTAAKVLPLAEAVRIVQRRGQLMQQAVPVGVGGMKAVLGRGAASPAVGELIQSCGLDVANVNGPDQVVAAGAVALLDGLDARLREVFGEDRFRVVTLNVSAPFHSRMMGGIEDDFRAVLVEAAACFAPKRADAVTSTFTGGFHVPSLTAILDGLTGQIAHTVRWMDNMEALCARASQIVEIGPSSPLRPLFESVGKKITTVVSLKSAMAHCAALAGTAPPSVRSMVGCAAS